MCKYLYFLVWNIVFLSPRGYLVHNRIKISVFIIVSDIAILSQLADFFTDFFQRVFQEFFYSVYKNARHNLGFL